MTDEEKLEWLYGILQTVGIPVAYRAWPTKKAPPMPYLCYLAAYTNNFSADGVVYGPSIDHYQVELYTKQKDPELESTVEAVLASSGIFWDKSEKYIDTENCYQIIYEFEV